MGQISQYELKKLRELNEKFKSTAKYADLKPDEAVTCVREYANLPSIVFILNSNGCSWLREKHGGCFMCGYEYLNYSAEKKTMQNFIDQVKNGISKYALKEFGVWLLASSFLDNSEIPENAQYKILEMLSNDERVKRIWVESRPRYVTSEKIKKIAKIIDKKAIEFFVAIGLETISDEIRLNLINKGYSLKNFENAIDTLKRNNLQPAAYVLFKPPLLSEQGAIADAVESINYCFDRNVAVSLCVTNIHPNTVLEFLYKAGKYKLPNLWSVVEVVKKAHRKGNYLFISEHDPSSFTINITPIYSNTCEKCSGKVHAALNKYSATQDIKVLESLDCECKKEWAKSLNKS